ncbi:Polynucleotide adenylyltransferase [Thioalkalivibrio sulfidiphilus HL-EbGr7]|uniref:Poly(A) polymerase I n=1 Tax=Thioalkalivibrio sulfidiphilus (strain HL-EbGR7) TaxID=396588 RepID=B8GNB2_THISH|nr:polynucleotide adenylyltransferase PcnB [Thioalkalivibrio sulfidiphilus]ACL71973.1 Polynucleotide adenylyltransferase [Thioalkalivibrio sulfidiphilus HL-EbGr7]
MEQHNTATPNHVSSPDASPASPAIIPRAEHGVSRANISKSALKVLYRLREAGFRACLVGGGVRDLLLGREPKDFDVATDAHPEQVRQLFRNCRLIGRRFRLAHVQFGREIIEVATFRAPHEVLNGDDDEEFNGDALVEDGRIIRDNVYGTIEQDAWRRDFTINALYYDIEDFSVVDYAGGMADLKAGVLRLIGDPEVRFREDPVRMLRAVRFAGKLGFRLDIACEQAIPRMAGLLEEVAPARLFDEAIKLFHSGYGLQTFEMLRRHDLFRFLFPATEEALSHEEQGFPITFVANALKSTDARIQEGKGVNPAFLYAVMLWEPVRRLADRLMENGELPWLVALQQAGTAVLADQCAHIAIPKRISLPMREIWEMQPRLEQRRGARALRLMTHPRFRAAYDFYCLRAQSGEALEEGCNWWTRIQEVDEAEQRHMAGMDRPGGGGGGGGRRKRRRRPRRSDGNPAEPQ